MFFTKPFQHIKLSARFNLVILRLSTINRSNFTIGTTLVNLLANELRKYWMVLVDFSCISSDGSNRRVDLIIYNKDSRNGFILDPTMRFECDENQSEFVNEKKKRLYEPCIADIQTKCKLNALNGIGQDSGKRKDTKMFCRVLLTIQN